VIVETKLSRGRSPADPYKDFVEYCEGGELRRYCNADVLRQRWSRFLRKERKFLDVHRQLSPGTCGTFPGIVPYSRQRKAIWQWFDIYKKHIGNVVISGAYERAVLRSLHRREEAGEPGPVFVGLVAFERSARILTASGERSMTALQRLVGDSRVVLRALSASAESKGLRIRCWTPSANPTPRS
jgi:hypothetical protein